MKVSFNSNVNFGVLKPEQKIVQASEELKFKPNAQMDSFNGKTLQPKKASLAEMAMAFLGKSKRKRRNKNNQQQQQPQTNPNRTEYPKGIYLKPGEFGVAPGKYRNIFPQTLKANPNISLKYELRQDKSVYDVDKAALRISSLSRYMKEEMVGFITPSGHHWFPKAAENIIHGAAGKRVPEEKMPNVAKEFWGLLAKADSYWTSEHFVNYLRGMDPNPGVTATIKAVKEIINEQHNLYKQVAFGYKSEQKEVKRLLENGCAYTGVPMERQCRDANKQVSAEHIFPHSKGGPDNDFNFIMAASRPNSDRGNIPLLDFLKGRSANDKVKKLRLV